MLAQRNRMSPQANQAVQLSHTFNETAQDVTTEKGLNEVVADVRENQVNRGVDGSQSTQSNSPPTLLLDVATFPTPNLISNSILTCLVSSNLTPSIDQVTTPHSSTIGFKDSYHFPSSSNYFTSHMYPSPPIEISRPNLRRSQFSSYRTEPTSDFISYSPSGLFPHHEEPEDETSDDDQASAQNGWTMAQRLREAALSDWESYRNVEPASPIRPVLSRNPSSNYFSSAQASHQFSAINSPSIPQQPQVQIPTRPNLYHSIRTWALQSNEATLRQPSAPVGESLFGLLAARTTLDSALTIASPSAVFASSPLAGRNTIFGSEVASVKTTADVSEDNNPDAVGEPVFNPAIRQPSPANRTSCSPLHRHLARRSASSSNHGLPTFNSLKQTAGAVPPLITTSSFPGSSSQGPSIGSVLEEEELTELANPILKIKNEALQSQGLGDSPALSNSGHLTVSARPKTKRYKSCGEIVQQKPALIKTSSDPLREKTLSVLGLIEFNMKLSTRSSFGASVPSSPIIRHDCGRAHSPYEMSTSYFPRFVS